MKWIKEYVDTETYSFIVSACQFEIVQCHLVYREEAHGSSIFWRHVGDCGPGRQR
jgi:hypothetical protein